MSSVKRYFGKLFPSLTILTKKEYLKELTLANLVCILYGCMVGSSVLILKQERPKILLAWEHKLFVNMSLTQLSMETGD